MQTCGGGTAKTDESSAGGDKRPSDGFDSAQPAHSEREIAPPKLSPEQRRAWADELCRRLTAAVASASPEGLGHWPPAWHMVEPASARLLETLADWEGSGDVADQRAAEQTADAVLYAWEHAARRWDAECASFERWAIEHEDDADTPTPEQWREL